MVRYPGTSNSEKMLFSTGTKSGKWMVGLHQTVKKWLPATSSRTRACDAFCIGHPLRTQIRVKHRCPEDWCTEKLSVKGSVFLWSYISHKAQMKNNVSKSIIIKLFMLCFYKSLTLFSTLKCIFICFYFTSSCLTLIIASPTIHLCVTLN